MKHLIPTTYPTSLEACIKILETLHYEAIGFPVIALHYNYLDKYWSVFFRNPAKFDNPTINAETPLEACHLMFNFIKSLPDEQLVVDTPENESLFDNDLKPDYQSAAYNNYEEEKEAAKPFKPAFKGDGTKEYGQKIIAAFNAVGIQNNGLTCCSENLYYFANQNNQIDLSTILPTDHTLEYL